MGARPHLRSKEEQPDIEQQIRDLLAEGQTRAAHSPSHLKNCMLILDGEPFTSGRCSFLDQHPRFPEPSAKDRFALDSPANLFYFGEEG